MGAQVEEFLKEGMINILGGCCGTTPDHIKVIFISDLAKKYKPPPRTVALEVCLLNIL